MKQNKEPQRFPIEPETVMAAYEILIKNCRNHHHTCQGCPLHITDPTPYQPSGIPRYTCAAFPGDNIPPAAWPELDPKNTDGGQAVAVDQEPQRIAIALARAGQRNPEGAKAFFKLIDNFCKEADRDRSENEGDKRLDADSK